MEELKLHVLRIRTPFYTLLIREIDGSVCGLNFGDYTVAFGVIAELDVPGAIKYTPYKLHDSKGLTATLNEFFAKHPAEEYMRWVETYIPALTDEPCRNESSLVFGASLETLVEELSKPSESKCFYPSICVYVVDDEFSPEFVDSLIELNAKYGTGCVYSDYHCIWLTAATKGLSVDGNFVDIPTEEELLDDWYEP